MSLSAALIGEDSCFRLYFLVIFTKISFLLYQFIKILARLALPIFCRKIIVNQRKLLYQKGPLLLACNHPNSFLDSIILDTLFQEPIWSLARGDVFKKPFHRRLLKALKILPVYRTSEGVENLASNYTTFQQFVELFRSKKIVMIFSEGKCINEWHLRPLKKGTARLAIQAWQEQIELTVLPVGINYSSFRYFGKNVFINFGKPILQKNIDLSVPEGQRHLAFNRLLQSELEQLVWEIDTGDAARQRQILSVKINPVKKILLLVPALIGFLAHAPLYIPLKKICASKTLDTDHFDSVITALLFLCYPFFLLLISLAIFLLTKNVWAFALLLALPFTAWSYVQLKPQTI